MGCEAAAMQPASCEPETAGLGGAVALMLLTVRFVATLGGYPPIAN